MYVFMYVCMYVCIYVCMYVCMYVCVYIYKLYRAYIYIRRMYVNIYIYIMAKILNSLTRVLTIPTHEHRIWWTNQQVFSWLRHWCACKPKRSLKARCVAGLVRLATWRGDGVPQNGIPSLVSIQNICIDGFSWHDSHKLPLKCGKQIIFSPIQSWTQCRNKHARKAGSPNVPCRILKGPHILVNFRFLNLQLFFGNFSIFFNTHGLQLPLQDQLDVLRSLPFRIGSLY